MKPERSEGGPSTHSLTILTVMGLVAGEYWLASHGFDLVSLLGRAFFWMLEAILGGFGVTVRDSSSGPLFIGVALFATGLVLIVALHLFVASFIVRLARAWHRGQPRR